MILITLQEKLYLTKDEMATYPLPEPPYVVITSDYIHYTALNKRIRVTKQSDEIPKNIQTFLKAQYNELLLQKLEQYL